MRRSVAGSGWVAWTLAACVWGCGGSPTPASTVGPPCPSVPLPVATQISSASAAPALATVDEALRFVGQIDQDLRRITLQRDRASWVNLTYITDDTDALASRGEESVMEYIGRKVREGRRFEGLQLPPDASRQLWLLKFAGAAPAPSDAQERGQLADDLTAMSSIYGKGKYCPERLKGSKKPCLALTDLEDVMAKSRKYDELLDVWQGWHRIAPPIRPVFKRYVDLSNKGAREIGFKDLGSMWRSGYDMPPEQFEAEVERLWQTVKPLYDELHCYVRSQLRKQYGADKVPDKAPIPAHLLGNMWAQEWNNIADMMVPYPKEPSFDITRQMAAKKYDALKMVHVAEGFFASLGFEPLPKTFWERSLLLKPQDRDVECHASAWDIGSRDDLRIKMCIKPNEEDLITIHHELGHIFYYSQYYKLPILYQAGAHDGFHEGIGDTIALSITPRYLKQIGLINEEISSDKARINLQMRQALDRVAFLPFGLLIDKWRWDVFSGKTPPDKYNEAWWALRTRYQGVAPPAARSENDFDPGAKYHVPANVPYVRYFLSHILQFQFHRALCRAAGETGPLDTCSVFRNKAAGEKLRAMLAMGASKPWPEALKVLSGETQMDSSALLEYFAPLRKWLQEQNKAQTCGW